MTIDDIRKFAHSNREAFLDFLFEDGFGPASVAEHLERKYTQTLRDQFAIAALPACLTALAEIPKGVDLCPIVARTSYLVADAMMAARKEPEA
jgi:hypothetical protein